MAMACKRQRPEGVAPGRDQAKDGQNEPLGEGRQTRPERRHRRHGGDIGPGATDSDVQPLAPHRVADARHGGRRSDLDETPLRPAGVADKQERQEECRWPRSPHCRRCSVRSRTRSRRPSPRAGSCRAGAGSSPRRDWRRTSAAGTGGAWPATGPRAQAGRRSWPFSPSMPRSLGTHLGVASA